MEGGQTTDSIIDDDDGLHNRGSLPTKLVSTSTAFVSGCRAKKHFQCIDCLFETLSVLMRFFYELIKLKTYFLAVTAGTCTRSLRTLSMAATGSAVTSTRYSVVVSTKSSWPFDATAITAISNLISHLPSPCWLFSTKHQATSIFNGNKIQTCLP
jgi:hypothetical protein